MFGALDELFEKTRIRTKDVGVLVVNCSIFNPTPSLSAMIINHYKMRGNILSYNLGGMGCSAGVIAIDLARDMLQSNPNNYAVVVSTEVVGYNWYQGRDRSMLIPNCYFRMGCSAVLLSNRRRDYRRAKYRLEHVVRTHKGADDRSFRYFLFLFRFPFVVFFSFICVQKGRRKKWDHFSFLFVLLNNFISFNFEKEVKSLILTYIYLKHIFQKKYF